MKNEPKKSEREPLINESEQIKILEAIARNEENYPRDRIAAVRALREIKQSHDELNELEALIPHRR